MPLVFNPPPQPGQQDKPLIAVSGTISVGQLLQAATVAGSILGAVFTAGGYVEQLRADMRATAQQHATDDTHLANLLRDLISGQQAAAAAAAATQHTTEAAVQHSTEATAAAAAAAAVAVTRTLPQAVQAPPHGE